MKNNKMITLSAVTCIIFIMFAGCGERTGQKEYNKALEAWKDGDLVRARTLFEKSIRKMSGSEKKSATLNQLGLVLWSLGETEAAADAFSKSGTLTETLTGADLNKGIALFHSGRFDEAEVALNNVIGENPKNQTALAMLGMIEMKKRNWAGATKELSKTVNQNPNSPSGQNALALAELHQNQNSEQAIKRLKQVASAFPTYAPAAYNLAIIYDQWLNKANEAKSWYAQYLKIAGSSGAYSSNATAALKRITSGNPAPVTRANPEASARFMTEGARLHAAKKYPDAVAQYEKAIQADPSQKNAFYNMGLAFYAQGKYAETASACKGALNLDSGFSDARYMSSLSYFQLKKWDEAKQEAQLLKKIDSKRGEEMLKHIATARK